jgi:hypothetical protein
MPRRLLVAAERVGGIEALVHEDVLDLGADLQHHDQVVAPGQLGRLGVLERPGLAREMAQGLGSHP